MHGVNSHIPLWAKPNAGMPQLDMATEKTSYPLATPDRAIACFNAAMENGATVFGLCCGSSPELIAAVTRSAT